MSPIRLLLTAVIIITMSSTAFSQVSADSINTLNQQKQSLELSSKINSNKIKLAKLENDLNKKTKEMQNTAVDAQKAADDNQSAAAALTNNPQDKSLARKAEKAANLAKKNAKKARNAADDVSNLQKDIQSVKDKIASDESKLLANPVLPSTPSTQQ